MSKIRSLLSFMKMLFIDLKEEWIEMDHKLIRIATGVLIFVLSALFWLYFFKSTSPFHF